MNVTGSLHQIRNPYSPSIPRATQTASGDVANPPLDTFAPVASHAAAPAPRSWKAVGLTALLAAPLIAGALFTASAAMAAGPAPAPPPPAAITCVLPQVSTDVTIESPITASTARLQYMTTANPQDNSRAAGVRQALGNELAKIEQHATAFAQISAAINQQTAVMSGGLTHDAGAYVADNGCPMTVEKSDVTGTTLRLQTDSFSAMLQQRADFRMASITQGGQTQTLQDSATETQVIDGNVTRTLYKADVAGHSAGDFEITIRQGGNAIVAGSQGQLEHIVVHGNTVTDETRGVISGFAGNINVKSVDTYEIPHLLSHVYPQVQYRETQTFNQTDAVTGLQTSGSSSVEIRQDGSTRVVESTGTGTHNFVEPHGPAPAAPAATAPSASVKNS